MEILSIASRISITHRYRKMFELRGRTFFFFHLLVDTNEEQYLKFYNTAMEFII